MVQQLIAVILIAFFIYGLYKQRKNAYLSRSEYALWLSFWSASLLLVIFIRQLDTLVARFGFSASGIDVLIYLAIAFLFQLSFRQRLRIEKMDRDISELNKELSLMKGK